MSGMSGGFIAVKQTLIICQSIGWVGDHSYHLDKPMPFRLLALPYIVLLGGAR